MFSSISALLLITRLFSAFREIIWGPNVKGTVTTGPQTSLEKTLHAVDELSSFVVAVALVRPTKSIHDVDVRAVKKKMKDKAFARAVNRDDIIRGAEELGMPLDDVVAQVIVALQGDAERLGLVGAS